jgi:hypothetical protein
VTGFHYTLLSYFYNISGDGSDSTLDLLNTYTRARARDIRTTFPLQVRKEHRSLIKITSAISSRVCISPELHEENILINVTENELNAKKSGRMK